jgi:hypothetical protein
MYFVSERLIYYLLTGQRKLLCIYHFRNNLGFFSITVIFKYMYWNSYHYYLSSKNICYRQPFELQCLHTVFLNIKSIFIKLKYVMYFVSERLIYYLLTGQWKLLFISKKLSILKSSLLKRWFNQFLDCLTISSYQLTKMLGNKHKPATRGNLHSRLVPKVNYSILSIPWPFLWA